MENIEKNLTATLVLVSFALFIVGLLFALGQSFHLGLEYFNTFTYSDFLRNTATAIPLLLAIMLVFAFFDFLKALTDIVRVPVFAFKDKKSSTKKRLLATLSASISVFLLIATPAYLSLSIKNGNSTSSVWGLVIAILIFLILVSISLYFSKYQRSYREDMRDRETKAGKTFRSQFFAILPYILIFSPMFGIASIQFQDRNKVTSALVLIDDERVEGNVLATNSTVVAIFHEGNVEIIGRSQIKKIILFESLLDYKTLLESEN